MRSLLLLSLLAFALNAHAQTPRPPQGVAPQIAIERTEGTSVTVNLGYGLALNKESKLKREWFTVRDPQAPATLDLNTGVDVIYKSGDRSSRGEYQYSVPYRIVPKEPITAFEVRVIVIDVFGKLVKTLSATELIDLSDARGFSGAWRIFSESEASEAFASVTYIAQVRTAAGRVYVADQRAVYDQVRRVATRITESDLEPKRESSSR